MTAIKKETCEEQLRRMCRSIAMDITEGDGTCASEFIDTTYDIRYLVGSDKKYLGAMLMVAGGGPTIWVNTHTNEVEGYWGGDRVTWSFVDNLGLDDYCEEIYNC